MIHGAGACEAATSSALGEGGLRRSASPARSVGVVEQTGSLSTVMVDVGVAHDRQQPRPRVGAIEVVESFERAYQGVLHEVLGVMRIPAQRAGDAQRDGEVRADERVERPDRQRQGLVRFVGL